MSEIAKCPVCGKDVKRSIWRPEYEGCAGSVVVTIKCCGMEAVSVPLWNQYAAAMELARAEVAIAKAMEVPLDRIDAALDAVDGWQENARERVLEVFGGE